MSISLINVARYYKQLPHQKQALTLLQQKIEASHPDWLKDDSEFVQTWRKPKDPTEIPKIEIISDGKQLRGVWRGKTYLIKADELKVRVLDAYDSETGSQVAREMKGSLLVDCTVNPYSGHIVVAVVLDYFAAVTTSGIFIIEPQAEGYAIYPTQVPGAKPFPDQLSTYGLRDISSLNFMGDNLIVKHGDAAGNISIIMFQPGNTPTMDYVNCMDILIQEGLEGACSRIGR